MSKQSEVNYNDFSYDSAVMSELPPLTPSTITTENDISYLTSPMFASSSMLFVISLFVFGLMGHLIKEGEEPAEILKTFGIPLIIVSSVFVVITGLDINKLTPVIGLLGTIAGYLLGKSSKTSNKPPNPTPTTIPVPTTTQKP